MMEMILGAWRAQGIAVAAELKVADALADGPLTADELARRVGADPDALARLMRALVGEGIFVAAAMAGSHSMHWVKPCGRTPRCRWRAWLAWSAIPTTASTGAAWSRPSGPARQYRSSCAA